MFLNWPSSRMGASSLAVALRTLKVDNGLDRFICAGPVPRHYELEVRGDPRRLNDEEWQSILGSTFPPDIPPDRIEGLAPPVWTKGYLVPQPAQ
jgi:hypothetical protein